MDGISVAGLFLGLAAIIVGQILEGGSVASLIQPTAFLIVVGGTVGAVMLQSPRAVFVRGIKMAIWVFRPPVIDPERLIKQIAQFANIARKEGLLSLESQIPSIKDRFMAKGMQLLVDGAEPDRLREVLEVEVDTWESAQKQAAKIWEGAGGYAPTIGILGAVMGLIHVMENLTDPSRLGAGIAVAFVATIYGVGSANLIFLPVAKKLLAIVARQALIREMLIDGLVGVANGDNPRIIESRMRGYLVS